MGQIDQILLDLWGELPESEQTLWALNCCGATVSHDSLATRSGESEEEEDRDSEDELTEAPDLEGDGLAHTPGQRLTFAKKRIVNLKLK